jgi:hypothetical protein
MKRLLFALVALSMFAFGPVPSARAWWWHRHHNPPPAGAGAVKKAKAAKQPKEARHRDKPVHLYEKPRSVHSWFHHSESPAPMGAGAEK